MEFIKQIERLQLLNKLVKEKRTGSPEELAERLGLSRRQLYSYLEFLKDYGMDIVYSRKTNSFIFNNGKELEIVFQFQVLEEDVSKEINGGKILENIFPCCFFARSETKLAS
ncbi:HTH domain-containing protein [Algoriphagus sp.]|uniref:HTH domain-containing protein n=1 Tax=Algoriphagus sp. TaxID=1872435 RepID=UPI003918B4B6